MGCLEENTGLQSIETVNLAGCNSQRPEARLYTALAGEVDEATDTR